MSGKPTVEELGIDVAAQQWRRSGAGDGSIEIAVVSGHPAAASGEDWVLMRVAGDPSGRVLVYDQNEWECFLDGVRNGEFDDALGSRPGGAPRSQPGGALGSRPDDALGNDAAG